MEHGCTCLCRWRRVVAIESGGGSVCRCRSARALGYRRRDAWRAAIRQGDFRMSCSSVRWLLLLPVLCFATTVCAQSPIVETTRKGTTTMEQGYVTAADGVRLHFTRVGQGSEVVIVPNEVYMVDDFKSLAADR